MQTESTHSSHVLVDLQKTSVVKLYSSRVEAAGAAVLVAVRLVVLVESMFSRDCNDRRSKTSALVFCSWTYVVSTRLCCGHVVFTQIHMFIDILDSFITAK